MSAARSGAGEETIADRIRQLIGAGSVNGFAKRCGVLEGSIRQYLRGVIPGAENLEKIASANMVTTDWLSTGREPKYRRDLSSSEVKFAQTGMSLAISANVPLRQYSGAVDDLAHSAAATEIVLAALRERGIKLSDTKVARLVWATALISRDFDFARGSGRRRHRKSLNKLVHILISLAAE